MRRRIISSSYSPWSAADEARAAALYADCKAAGLNNPDTYERIAAALCKTVAAIRGRRKIYGATFANARRQHAAGYAYAAVPESVLVERDRRLQLAERHSITGALMGDPPPGCSALERARR